MTAFPKARRGAPTIELDPTTAAVWAAADGATSVAAIAEQLGVGREAVWAALDELADLDLLERRAGPPAGLPTISRRAALGLAGAGAAGLGAAAIALPAAAEEQAYKSAREDHKKTSMELAAAESKKKRAAHEMHATEQDEKSHVEMRATEQKRKRSEHEMRAAEEEKKHARMRATEERQKRSAEQAKK